MPQPQLDRNRLIRYSQLVALVFLIGFAMVGSAVGYNLWKLHTLERETDVLQTDLDGLKEKERNLKNNVLNLRYSLSTETIVPRAQALRFIADGKLYYDLSIWIDLSNFRSKQVRQVTYRSSHPELREVSVSRPSTGFASTFRSQTSPGRVTVDVAFTDGTTQNTVFAMCKAVQVTDPQGQVVAEGLPCY
jgi:cell division protein FtsB